jgi:hypothetical protein
LPYSEHFEGGALSYNTTQRRTPRLWEAGLPVQDIALIAAAVQPIFQSLADAQKAQAESQSAQAKAQAEVQMHAEVESTKRHQMSLLSLRQIFLGVFIIYGLITVMAGVALWTGQKEFADKIVLGLFSSLFSLLGGIGIGRAKH